jgi:anti-sigma factor RsiW
MSNTSDHIEFDVLNDFIDGRLDRRAASDITAHLAACPTCSAQHDELARLLASATQLPRSVLPPDDMWADLRTALNSRKDVLLPTTSENANRPTSIATHARLSRKFVVMLAAAAVVLIALSSGITALVLKRNPTTLANRGSNDVAVPAPQQSPAVLPASFRQAENEYNRTIDELKQAVDTQRDRLSPETIRTVDHSLAVVDSAIREARAALIADPNNQMLMDLLSTSYQRKLDLLRRTSELGSRT